MPPSPAAAAIATFARRVVLGAFVVELLRAVMVTAIAGAAVLIALRLAGRYEAPHPVWAAVAVPVIAFAWWRARRARLTNDMAAIHLDRRLGANGLLLCARDGVLGGPLDDETWGRELAVPLRRLPDVLPRIQWRRVLPWPAFAVLLATVVAMLPPLDPPPPPLQHAAVAAEVERTAEALRDLLARGAVPEEAKQEIEQKLRELQQRLAAGDVPEWRDVDQLAQRLEREQLLQAAADPAKRAAGDAPGGERNDATAAAKVTPEQVAAAANALDAAGLLADLPEGLRAMLESLRGDRGFDAASLAKDVDALRRLAEAMAAAGVDLAKLDVRGKLDPGQLADLQALVDEFAANGAGAGFGEGEGNGEEGEGAGRGGVDRGPGHAALAMTEDAQGSADAAMPLPPGVAAPTEWIPIGSKPSEPDVNPQTNTGVGGPAATGPGGATWQLQLAPRHRAVVQRFFRQPATEPPKERR